MGISLFVLEYMYISLLLKMINVFSWPAKIMASPFKIRTLTLNPNQKNKSSPMTKIVILPGADFLPPYFCRYREQGHTPLIFANTRHLTVCVGTQALLLFFFFVKRCLHPPIPSLKIPESTPAYIPWRYYKLAVSSILVMYFIHSYIINIHAPSKHCYSINPDRLKSIPL